MEEVEKFLAAGFIRDVFYPKWLTNVVMAMGNSACALTLQTLTMLA